MSHEVLVYNSTRSYISKRVVVALVDLALSMSSSAPKDVSLSILFVGAGRMRTLNRVFRGKDCVTDVLSFGYSQRPLEGDVFVCIPQAKKQATLEMHSLTSELYQLVIHGVLHIFGYDHTKEKDAQKMQTIETAVWTRFQKLQVKSKSTK